MSSVNRVILLGHLGRDPEVRATNDGSSVATLSLATSERWKAKDGAPQERTEWHRVVLFGRLGEVAGQYLSKGKSAYLEGKLVTRKWTDKSGAERYTTEIVADTLKLLGGGNAAPERVNAPSPKAPSPKAQDADAPFDDDIPF